MANWFIKKRVSYRNYTYLGSQSPYKQYRSARSKASWVYRPINIIPAIVIAGLLVWRLPQAITKKPVSSKSQPRVRSSQIKPISNLPLPDIKQANAATFPKRRPEVSDLRVPAKTALLIDATASYPLFMKNERASIPIASLTKIMTAVVSLEEYDLAKQVTVSREAVRIPGSDMNLRSGEQITVQDLLYGLLLDSGNDAAYALAEQLPNVQPGQYQPFVDKMNQKAQSLGLQDTKFLDPAGLDDNGRSTAYDLVFLTAYALRLPTFATIVSTPEKVITSIDGKISHQLKNTNRLIVPTEPLYFNTAIGVKTGYTEEAGHCLIAAARHQDHILISAVLNTNNPAKDESARLNRQLLDWGIQAYDWGNNQQPPTNP